MRFELPEHSADNFLEGSVSPLNELGCPCASGLNVILEDSPSLDKKCSRVKEISNDTTSVEFVSLEYDIVSSSSSFISTFGELTDIDTLIPYQDNLDFYSQFTHQVNEYILSHQSLPLSMYSQLRVRSLLPESENLLFHAEASLETTFKDILKNGKIILGVLTTCIVLTKVVPVVAEAL